MPVEAVIPMKVSHLIALLSSRKSCTWRSPYVRCSSSFGTILSLRAGRTEFRSAAPRTPPLRLRVLSVGWRLSMPILDAISAEIKGGVFLKAFILVVHRDST